MALEVSPNILSLIAGQGRPPPGPDWGAIDEGQRTAIAVQQNQQKQAGVNALSYLYSDPNNFQDAKTMLQPKPEVMARVMQMAGPAAMDLQSNFLAMQNKQLQQEGLKSEVIRGWNDEAVNVIGKQVHDQRAADIINGVPIPEADAKANAKYNELMTPFKVGKPPSYISNLAPNYDDIRYQKNATTLAQQQQLENLKKQGYSRITQQTPGGYAQDVWVAPGKPTLDMQGNEIKATGIPVEKRSELPETLTVDVPGRGRVPAIQMPGGGFRENKIGGQVLEEAKDPQKITGERPKTIQQLATDQYVATHPNATAEELAHFAQTLRPPRSGPAAAVQKFMDENPSASASDIVAFNAWARETGAGAQAFGSGTQGNTTRAQNVAIDHLQFLSDDLVPALKNREMRSVNALTNWAKTEFGYTGPVDFDFAKGIVSQEIEKSIVNVGAGTEAERANLSRSLSTANSPEQLNKVIGDAKRLMAGQLRGLQQQYVDVTVPPAQRGDPAAVTRAQESFQQKLFPRTRQELGLAVPGGAAAAPSGDHTIRQGHEQEDWDAIPSGQKTPYKLWDGRTGVKP